MEAYPVLAGFGFEDRTLPVDVREIGNTLTLYQRNNTAMTTMIEISRLAKNENALVSLYVTPNHLKRDLIVKDFSAIINTCI